jgi:hypothetical protein
MEDKDVKSGVKGESLEISLPRRASLLVKFVVSILVIMGVAWFVSALREKKEVLSEKENISQTFNYPEFESVTSGGKEYSLGGVEFVFEPEQPNEQGEITTRVRLKINDFKRDGAPIEVGRYRLGTYRGECEQFDGSVYMTMSSVDPGALAFAQCVHDGIVRRLAVFQEDNNLVVKTRSLVEEREVAGLVQILSVDVTEIIK